MVNVDEIILTIVESQTRVLEIYHPSDRVGTLRYFATISFTPASGTNDKHSLTGIDITKIITTDSLSVLSLDTRNKEAIILTKLQDLRTVSREYSKDFAYIWHTAVK